MSRVIIPLIIILGVAGIAYVVLRNNSVKKVMMELPKGYRGVVSIVLDKTAKNKSTDKVLQVGPSGRLEVSSLDPFYDWHSVASRFADGRELRYMNDGNQGGIAIWPLSERDKGVVKFFVGREEEWKKLQMKEQWGKE